MIFRCDILDWHSPKEIGFNGVNFCSYCKRCGRRILQDSQGNWFSIEVCTSKEKKVIKNGLGGYKNES